MHKKQNGFGAPGIIAVLLVVGVLGLSAWYIWSIQKPAANQAAIIPTGYRLYKNSDLSFIYPEDWVKQGPSVLQYYDKSTLAAFVSPQTEKVYEDFIASGRAIDGPPSSDLVVSKWQNINDTGAKGGDSTTDRTYSSLRDFLYDTKNTEKIKQPVGTLSLNGATAYEVSVGGFDENYGVMLEHNGSIYELDFITITDKQEVTPVVTRIVQSLKFN